MSDPLYGFRTPMLAHTLGDSLPTGTWVAEQKFDGHRLIVSLKGDVLRAWSRLGTPRDLPNSMRALLCNLPDGVYDGELIVPGGTSQNVKELIYFEKLELILFDVLTLGPSDITVWPQERRRETLEFGFSHMPLNDHLRMASQVEVTSLDDVFAHAHEHWGKGNEGLILKNVKEAYRCGKRSRAFLKVKQEMSTTLTVVGFASSKGEKVDRGLCAQVVLQDDLGTLTVVKTVNDNELEYLNTRVPKDPELKVFRVANRNVEAMVNHPDCGRRALIEYQMRTPDGSYRHGRWDRWEDE